MSVNESEPKPGARPEGIDLADSVVQAVTGTWPADIRALMARQVKMDDVDGVRIELSVDTATKTVSFNVIPHSEKGFKDHVETLQPIARALGLEIVIRELPTHRPKDVKENRTRLV
jgi:hypothetical protein